MKFIKCQNRSQITFLPDCIDDLIEQDNAVRVIDVFVDNVDMEEAGFQKSIPSWTGRPPYDPRDLFKLYVYGYFNKIRSSRKLMLECRRNIELFFLLNRLAPDFRTIADFRKDNNCVMNGIIPNVALKYDKCERLYTVDYVEAEITDEERNSKKPEDIQKCISAGVLPVCYVNTVIEVELQEQSFLSCFTLNEDGTVTCPMGKRLSKIKMRGKNTIYGSKEACRQCPNKCTDSKNHKTVSFGPYTKYVPVRMYGRPNIKLNPIPEDIHLNPYNHTLDRKDHSPKKVVLRIKEDIHKIKERMCLSEHPFGTVKWYHGAHYLLCKGKEKATAELGLSFLAYNMKRAINMVGVKKLIAAM